MLIMEMMLLVLAAVNDDRFQQLMVTVLQTLDSAVNEIYLPNENAVTHTHTHTQFTVRN